MYSNRLQPGLQNLLQRVVRFLHPRLSCMTHISADVQGITLNASCMTISGGRTEQLIIIAGFLPHVTGFTSDFLSFIVVEHIRFFHGALQLIDTISPYGTTHALFHASTLWPASLAGPPRNSRMGSVSYCCAALIDEVCVSVCCATLLSNELVGSTCGQA